MMRRSYPSHLAVALLCTNLLFANGVSWAQDGKYRPDVDLNDCLFQKSSPSESQEEAIRKRACYEPAMAYARSTLNRAVAELTATGVPPSSIEDVQKKWETFVKEDCTFQTALPPSPLGEAVSIMEACYLKHTSDRANELMWIKILHAPARQAK